MTGAPRVRTPARTAVVAGLAERVVGLYSGRVVRVGVDRVGGGGKTVFANELAEAVTALSRPVIRAVISTPGPTRRRRADPEDTPPNRRYVQGQLRYLDQCRPAERATVVVADNENLAAPVIVRSPRR